MDGRTEGAGALVLAVFRLAVADHRGLSYGHEGPDRCRRIDATRRLEAATFLRSPWAVHLADLIGLEADVIWAEARRLATRDRATLPRLSAA